MINAKTKKNSFFKTLFLGEEKEYLVENLAMMLESGLDILAALDALKRSSRSGRIKEIISEMEEDINSGMYLWETLEKIGLFQPHVISLIKLGEKSGNLANNFRAIAEQQQKDRVFRSKIRSAMMYPVFVMGLTVIVGVGIAWFILPRLATVFKSMTADLPLITKILIQVGKFLGDKGTVVVPLAMLAVILISYFVFFFSRTKIIGEKILLILPGVNRMLIEVELARFGYLMGTLLGAGLPLVEAINSIRDATEFRIYKKIYSTISDSVNEGNSFKKTFENAKIDNKFLQITIQQLIIAGERSGELDEVFIKIGKIFEAKTETTTKDLATILEPILLVIVWLGVVAVALAVILPIYSLIGQLR